MLYSTSAAALDHWRSFGPGHGEIPVIARWRPRDSTMMQGRAGVTIVITSSRNLLRTYTAIASSQAMTDRTNMIVESRRITRGDHTCKSPTSGRAGRAAADCIFSRSNIIPRLTPARPMAAALQIRHRDRFGQVHFSFIQTPPDDDAPDGKRR